MNPLSKITLEKANREVIYNLYLYLADKIPSSLNKSLAYALKDLESAFKNQISKNWSERDKHRLGILKNAVKNNIILANSQIISLAQSKIGLNACVFKRQNGDISVVFRGTAGGEWIDNGEGLSGIPEENTYITYGKSGRALFNKTLYKDYATDRQVEALNWFRQVSAQNGWNENTNITVSGHSKGGNKAQFVAIHTDYINECYSFDGQGFSPEAIKTLKKQYDTEFEKRQLKLKSFSAYNDYVNVLGERLVPDENIYYFKSQLGIHYIEAILDINGKFLPQSEQGKLSQYIESVSKDIMSIKPFIRKYATLGVMNVFQKYLGEDTSVSDDRISTEKTITGIALAIGVSVEQLRDISVQKKI